MQETGSIRSIIYSFKYVLYLTRTGQGHLYSIGTEIFRLDHTFKTQMTPHLGSIWGVSKMDKIVTHHHKGSVRVEAPPA